MYQDNRNLSQPQSIYTTDMFKLLQFEKPVFDLVTLKFDIFNVFKGNQEKKASMLKKANDIRIIKFGANLKKNSFTLPNKSYMVHMVLMRVSNLKANINKKVRAIAHIFVLSRVKQNIFST